MKLTPRFKRVFVIVMDSVGIGEAPDAEEFGDAGSHTLRHIAEKMDGLHVPVLSKLGLSLIDQIPGVPKVAQPATFSLLDQNARGFEWEGYNDRTLGNHGPTN